MALIVIPNTFTVGAVIIASQHNANFTTISSDYNGNIQDANIASNAAIADSKLSQITTAGKISGAALTSLTSIPAGAGIIPAANLPAIAPLASYVKCSNTQISGTGGGTTTSGSYQTAVLNTKDNDTGSIATLSGNQISLPSGTYTVRAVMPLYKGVTLAAKIRLYNVTDSTVLIIGGTLSNGITNQSDVLSYVPLSGLFILSGTKSIALQYYVNTGSTNNGQGTPSSLDTEVYAVVELTKVA